MHMFSQKLSLSYGLKIAIVYTLVWFIDLLDASILNVALPSIAQTFHISAPDAEWAIVGFLLALTLAIPVSGWLARAYGAKNIFLFSQALYCISSLACGFSLTLGHLIGFRVIQGAAGGLLIPVGMTLLMQSIPPSQWSAITSRMNMVTLIAPALGPLLAGYVTAAFGWPWLFFSKVPLSCMCLVLSSYWVRKDQPQTVAQFDWAGFILLTMTLSTLFMGLTHVGTPHGHVGTLGILFGAAVVFGIAFVVVEGRVHNPLLALKIFRYRLFSVGNIIQCAANIIFLGATFITGLYLQQGLGFDMVTTGWMLAAITPGMLCALPLVSRYYNYYGPLPFIIPGLLLMSCSMVGLTFITSTTSAWTIAFFIFCEGAASAIIQTPNVIAIFSEIPSSLKGDGSALYALGKQLSASMGVALSTMIVSLGMKRHGITDVMALQPGQALPLFHATFYVLGLIPLLALFACLFFDNLKARTLVKKSDHLESEPEMGLK